MKTLTNWQGNWHNGNWLDWFLDDADAERDDAQNPRQPHEHDTQHEHDVNRMLDDGCPNYD